jgi:diguanylate cyclase (GGDEF)-like protein|tara:strand:- start:1634 stop:3304 length:1671 start_codon:yes stop_codon:yes gene_type:complete
METMTDSGSANAVASRLAELRERFAERAADDLSTLEQLARASLSGQSDNAVVQDVLARLHRLAGSAGTFGFPELGVAARNLEKMLKAHFGAGGESLPVLAVEKLLALRTLLENPPVPAVETEALSPAAEDPEGSHGFQVRVLLAIGPEINVDVAEQALVAYGFDCLHFSYAEPGELEQIAAQSRSATVVLASESCIDKVLHLRDGSRIEFVRRLPVICLSLQDDFDSRYRIAGLGADAFFGEPLDLPDLTERIEYLAMERSTRVSGRVVLVEDDAELAEHYSLVLRSAGVDVLWVNDPIQLAPELATFRPDILLMDVQLGDYSGITLARLVRFDPQWLSLPIIYLSSEDDPDNQLEALSRGADEFLMKPVSDGYLIRSVLIRCFRARQLSRLMNRDSLTGLLKHSLIKQEVDKELARCRREQKQASVAMVDLDHFKQINDTWGHRSGDIVIKALANMLRNRLRETDRIGRYGGEEFLLVLPGCDPGAAAQLLSEIAEAFALLSFSGGDDSFHVTLSAGVAAIEAFPSGDEAIEAADKALYNRKRSGRNGVTVFTHD